MVDLFLAFLLVQPIIVTVTLIHSYRLKRYVGDSSSMKLCFESMCLSLTMGLIMPVRTNEFVKSLYLKYKGNVDLSIATAAVVVERIYDLLFFLLVSSAVFLWIGFSSKYNYVFYIVFTFCMLIAAVSVYLLAGNRVAGGLKRINFERTSDFIKRNVLETRRAVRNGLKVEMFAFGLFAWILTLCIYGVYFFVATSYQVEWASLGVLFVAGTIGMGAGVTPGSLGTFEAALSAVLISEELEITDIVIVVLVFRVATSIFAALVTCFILARDGVLIAKIKKDAKKMDGKSR